jgi:hypothetical protein
MSAVYPSSWMSSLLSMKERRLPAGNGAAAAAAARRKRKLKWQQLKWKRVQEAAAVSRSLLEPTSPKEKARLGAGVPGKRVPPPKKNPRGTDSKGKRRDPNSAGSSNSKTAKRGSGGKTINKNNTKGARNTLARKGKHDVKNKPKLETNKNSISAKASNKPSAARQLGDRKRLLVLGRHKLLGMRYAEKSKGFCQLLEGVLTHAGKKELSKAQKSVKFKLLWHHAKVEALTYPCQHLRDALGECALGGAGRLGLQLQAAKEEGWPYTHVLVVDDFLPGDGCPSIAAVRETVQEIISASVQSQVKSVVLCALPNDCSATIMAPMKKMRSGGGRGRRGQKEEENDHHIKMEDPQSPFRPHLQGLMGLTLHSNGFSGFDDTTEVLVHYCLSPTSLKKEQRTATRNAAPLSQATAAAKSPSTAGISSVMLPDINMMVDRDREDDNEESTARLAQSLSTPPHHLDPLQKKHAAPKKRTPHHHHQKNQHHHNNNKNNSNNNNNQSLPAKRKRTIATDLGTFLVNQSEEARQARLRLQILAHNVQRERRKEMRQARADDALQKMALRLEVARELELDSRTAAKAEAEAAGLPAKLARQKRIAWEAWLAGERKREKRERRDMEHAEDECRAVWDETVAIAQRREKARQRELTQARKRKRKVDKAIIAVLTYARKMYLKQEAKLDPADAELRAIQAAEMKKMGRKQKALLDGWTTRKRILAEAFAKLPFVCTPETFFERMGLMLHLGHVERSFAEPKLDTSFGPLVTATQGSPKMTYTGADFSHKLKIGAPFSVKGEVFKVMALRPNEVELDNQFSGTNGKYKALFLEEGPVARFRLVPEEERPVPLSVLFEAVSKEGRVW